MSKQIPTIHKLSGRMMILIVLSLSFATLASGVEASTNTTEPASGHTVSIQGIQPADVFARVQWLRKELDDVRFEMGRAKSREVGLIVEDATPHEVFFQAKILYQKIDRLNQELTGEPELPLTGKDPEDIQPFHVWTVVDQALRRLLYLKNRLDIPNQNSEAVPDPSTPPTQVFFVIGFASQQLNHLLSHQFSPKDVMDEINISMAYASKLLSVFPDHQKEFPSTPLERGRKPSDVYYRLSDCYLLLGEIAKQSHVPMLRLSDKNLDRPNIHPNDVYDLAALLVSELAYLHHHIPHIQLTDPQKSQNPILPSHVYQQAGRLYSQLEELHRQVQANPKWLKK